MLPILLVTKSPRSGDTYARVLAVKHGIPASSIVHFKPEKESLKIDDIRSLSVLCTRLRGTPIVVVHSFHTATAVVQNALLKTLEEKSQIVQFVLVVEDPSQLLPTVLSRCVVVRGDKKGRKVKKVNTASHSSVGTILYEYTGLTRPQALALCDDWIDSAREKMHLISNDTTELRPLVDSLKQLLTIRSDIAHTRISQGTAMDQLLIEFTTHKRFPGQ